MIEVLHNLKELKAPDGWGAYLDNFNYLSPSFEINLKHQVKCLFNLFFFSLREEWITAIQEVADKLRESDKSEEITIGSVDNQKMVCGQ